MQPGGNPPHGPGAGDEPVTGGWGVGTALLFLSGFSLAVVVLFAAAGAGDVVPLPVGEGLLDAVFLAGVVVAVVAPLAFLAWLVYAALNPEVDLV